MCTQLTSQRSVTQGYLEHTELFLHRQNMFSARKIAQPMMSLLCRYRELSFSPRIHIKKKGGIPEAH